MLKKIFFFILFFLFSISIAFTEDLKFTKILNLDKPWGSSFINKNELIITEKGGKIKIVNIKTEKVLEIEHNLNFLEYGQGGLLDIIYKNENVWISYAEDRGNQKTSTSIAKAKIDKNRLNFKNIFQSNPPINSRYHFGSRLAIKGDIFLLQLVKEEGE